MKTITLQLLGPARTFFSEPTQVMHLSDDATFLSLRKQLQQHLSEQDNRDCSLALLAKSVFATTEICEDESAQIVAKEVALLPPVSGG